MRVLRQHELGLQVQAEVIKSGESTTTTTKNSGTVPTVTELDDNNEAGHDFQNGQSHHWITGRLILRGGESGSTSPNDHADCADVLSVGSGEEKLEG